MFEIHNSGDTSVGYTIDTKPLDNLQASNYLMPILKCLQPRGEIPPGCTVPVEFVFSPLEAKKYTVSDVYYVVKSFQLHGHALTFMGPHVLMTDIFQVDLPIHLTSGTTVLVMFTGKGYDPKQSESETGLCYENTSVGCLNCSACRRKE